MQKSKGPDGRQWRVVEAASPCKKCGKKPIAARVGQRAVGWDLQCPTDARHGYHFEQWIKKCIRKWEYFHAPKEEPDGL